VHGWRDHDLLREALDVFGLVSLAESQNAPSEVVALAEARLAARGARDFEEADRLRDEITGAGWEVRDVEAGYELVPIA
jgi:cysteinyl-tRNA synthetase